MMITRKAKATLNYVTSLGGKANPQITRFFRYSLTGGFSTSLDFLLLFILTDFFGVFYIVSAIISYILANTLNYLVNRKWAYKGTSRTPMKGYALYLMVNLSTLLVVVVLLGILVEFFGFYYLVARIMVGVVVGIFNFIANSKISFMMPVFRKN